MGRQLSFSVHLQQQDLVHEASFVSPLRSTTGVTM